jgi:hypothetical protein
MRSRILCIALASSLLAVAFAAVSTSAAVDFTGSVMTTDNAGAAKSLFFRGEPVYVNVELRYQGTPYDGAITVQLVRTTDGSSVSQFNDRTNDPDVGWLNSSVSVPNRWLNTGTWFDGELMVYDVVVYYTGGWWWDEIARTQVTVKAEGLWMEPGDPYYPGEQVTISLVTANTGDVFYVQIVNETDVTKVNWTGQVALEGWWSTVWTIAADFADGQYTLRVRDADSHATWESETFDVQKYILMVDSDRSYFLPGETAKLTYAVFEMATLTPYSGVVISYSAHWLNSSGNDTWQNDTLTDASGVLEFAIADDIALYSDVIMTWWANETNTSRTAEETVWLQIGELGGDLWLDDTWYMPGETVRVDVSAMVEWDDLPDASVDIAVEWNNSVIAAYGASGLLTNLNGRVTHTFQLAANAPQGTYIVWANISKMDSTITRMSVFNVEWDGELYLTLDKQYYYGGDTVIITFRTVWNNQDVEGASKAYIVWIDSGILTTGSTTQNTATFQIPTGYYGNLYVEAGVNLNGYMLGAGVGAEVHLADVVLTAASPNYKSGDTVTFLWQISSSLATATLEYRIVDAEGVVVASGPLTYAATGSITYDVPGDPSGSYTATLTLRSGVGGVVSASATVEIYDDFELMIWISGSPYTSGMFKPGDKVKIEYSINTYSQANLPIYKIVLWLSWSPTSVTVLVTEPEGTITIEVPETAPSGWFWVDASLYDGVSGDYLSGSGTMFMVNSELSAWDRSVGGLSLIDLIILLLLVIIFVVMIVMPWWKRRAGAPKEPAKAEPPPPTTPPGTP